MSFDYKPTGSVDRVQLVVISRSVV
ncbi:hypothetical protein CCACVL1_01632 [Corchorus capsularis]|uniref:Uncharacterized protein n=1 Tax=Corchorus capsularis TaxID=210143 RepID=A0A1R3KGS7_COCAP|nr:hypothetical protein CCACVL1_01632 [Corchorus capsularis]